MSSTQRSWQQTTTDVVFLCVGVGVFWIPYVLLDLKLGSLLHWCSIILFPTSIYMAGIGMARLTKRSNHLVSSIAVVLNLIGIVAFLYFASECWIEPELANEPGASGGAAIVWGFTALPILLGFFTLDLAWFISECVRYMKTKTFPFGWTLLFILAMWVGTAYYDGIHHGI